MSSEREKVEHRVYPRFERFVIGKEWKSHDEAFYQAKKTNFAQAAYWFWLFSEINDAASRKVCVLISRIGKKHYLNGKKIVGKNYSQNRFRGASWCWTYENQKVETLFQGMAEVEIGNKKIEANLLDSSHTIQAHGSFPNYTLRLLEDGGEVGFFKTTGTRFSQPLTQNKYLKMRSIQAISDGKESFAKIDRVSQFPYCASNMADLFAPFQGNYRDWQMSGRAWIERARSYGMVANWKLALVYFEDGSRLWFRFFTGTTLTYQEPLNFYFDLQQDGKWKRFPFYKKDWIYFKDERMNEPHSSIYENTKFLSLKGSGPEGDIEVLLKYNDAFLARYRAWRFEARYYQLAFDVVSLLLKTKDGRIITEKELGKSVGYGEETFKRRWRETFFESEKEAKRKYVRHNLRH